MKQADLRININGQNVSFPLEAFDLNLKLNYENDNIQPYSDVEDLTIYGEGVDIVNDWINSGLYYKGLPIQIRAVNSSSNVEVLDAYINLPKLHEIIQDGQLRVGISLKDNKANLNERLESITWDLLVDKGVVNSSSYSSVDYVVEKTDNALELVILTVTLYIMTKELIESITETIDLTNKTVTGSIPTVGIPPSVTIGAIIYAVLSIILNILYIALILIAIINMGIKLFELLVQPKRTHKMMNFRRGCEILATYLGYTFYSTIPELDRYNYLPSNIEMDDIDLTIGSINFPKGVNKGIPKSGDYGYTGLEWFDIMQTMFEAKITIDNGILIMLPKSDPYWLQNSTYVLPDIDIEKYTNNANELVFSRLIKYETDPIADEYTLSNFTGTNYQVLTNDTSLTQGADDNFIKKHETISLKMALGTRKDRLNAFESTLKNIGGIIDNITGIFGGGTSLAQRVQNRIGVLKVGTNNFTKAKMIYLAADGKMPINHRDLSSAKYLYNNYIKWKSFVLNSNERQRAVYELENIPFGLEDFNKIVRSGVAKLHDGTDIKILNAEWNILEDTAKMTFDKKDVYAPNLYEQYIEQN